VNFFPSYTQDSFDSTFLKGKVYPWGIIEQTGWCPILEDARICSIPDDEFNKQSCWVAILEDDSCSIILEDV
jgi:hypothetical protein